MAMNKMETFLVSFMSLADIKKLSYVKAPHSYIKKGLSSHNYVNGDNDDNTAEVMTVNVRTVTTS